MSGGKIFKIAILDLYEGAANQGMRCIREIINLWGEQQHVTVTYDEFEVRQRTELPGLEYDAFISSGGPGSPLSSQGTDWENAYFAWIGKVVEWNNDTINGYPKKPIFFICHSFQLACRYFNIGNVCKRKSTAFGVFPIHMTHHGEADPVFKGLTNPFYVVDSRDYQVLFTPTDLLNDDALLLAIEKDRPHVPLDRAMMAIRFNAYCVGTQFHPEADAVGMLMYLQTPDKKKVVIDNHGEAKWQSMVEQLNDPDKISFTYSVLLPDFLNEAMRLAFPVYQS